MKHFHELRDPIHAFVRLSSDERRVLDSHPFQRLRQIHQLALTYLVYPRANHRRFEHSLGVMELADRVYGVVTRPENLTDWVRDLLPELADAMKREYWRRVLRMAALCHDIGHLPFSHAAEKELLPPGKSQALQRLPVVSVDTVYAAPEICHAASKWLKQHKEQILRPVQEENP
jgi:HD superfamily phosphohydrolase